MSKGKGESGTNNLLDQQTWANLRWLLVWHSGDEDGLQSHVWSSNPGECKIKKLGGLGLGIGLGLGGQ